MYSSQVGYTRLSLATEAGWGRGRGTEQFFEHCPAQAVAVTVASSVTGTSD